MYQPLLISLSLIGLLSSCSDNTKEQSYQDTNKNQGLGAQNSAKSDNSKPVLEHVNPAEKQLSIMKLEAIEKNKAVAKKLNYQDKSIRSKHLTFNKEKFELLSPVAEKGAKLFNLSIHEYGIMKGSIVVVVDNTSPFKTAYFSEVLITKIAKDTYRLTPDTKLELMNLYKTLNNMPEFKVIEMEIDYSPILQEE